ncbi:MAG TPA: M56 family metallopeptidase [Hyphomicrobiales bacterium]|nr:M56 family metallopeptidase [Hyphomicrobiales bacterium]
MLSWLLVNVGLSLLALAFIFLNGGAPHRLRFFAGFAALAAWLVPWTLLPELPLAIDFSWELGRIERAVDAGSARLTGVYPIIVQTSGVPLARDFLVLNTVELMFIALTAIGAVLFVWNLASHHYRLSRLARQGSDGSWLWHRAGLVAECPVVVQREIPGAFSSGLVHPCIWVHDDLVASPQLSTLLHHELTHIRQHDNWYLLAITLVEKLFWWNPLVWYLGRETRELQELSCDEQCQRSIGDYAAQLAQLMLDSARMGKPRMLALSVNILNDPNPNVKRIKLLQRSYAMKTRHIVSAALTALVALSGIGLVTAQPEAAQSVTDERVLVRLVRGQDQFMNMDAVDGTWMLSLNFTDAPLPMVLKPIAVQVFLSYEKNAGTEVIESTSGHEVYLKRGWREGDPIQYRYPLPRLSDSLVLEHPEAANKLVSVSGDNLTLDEAIALIAQESGCNIFEEGNHFVVDYCN